MVRELVGRDRDLEALRKLLASERVVAITGPPGVGKTRLAAEVPAALWVGLDEAATEGELWGRLARAVSAPSEHPSAVMAALPEGRIVLDGVGASGLPDELQRSTLLLTSRREVAGALDLELGPLEPSDGVALLQSCVRSSKVRETLRQSDAERLVRAVDAVPLAIELLAPRLRVMGVEALLERPLPPGGDPLTGAVRELVGSLAQGPTRLLRQLVLCEEPWSLNDLEEVLERPVETDVVALLETGLLVRAEGRVPHFRVLAPIRHALEAPTSEAAELAPRILALAERDLAEGTAAAHRSFQRWLGWLEGVVRHGPVEAAHDAAHQLARRNRRVGAHHRTLELLDSLDDPTAPALRVRRACDAVDALMQLNRVDEARRVIQPVEDQVTDETRRAWTQRLAMTLWFARDLAGARKVLLDVVSDDDPEGQRVLGAMHADAGDRAGAIAACERALAHPDPFDRAVARAVLATNLFESGLPPSSALHVLDQMDLEAFPLLAPRVANLRAMIAAASGDLESADAALAEAERQDLSMGRRAPAMMRWVNRRALPLARGEVPLGLLDPSPYDVRLQGMVAYHEAWRSVVHALRGDAEGALSAFQLSWGPLMDLGPHAAHSMAAFLAMALRPAEPEAADELLDRVPPEHEVRKAVEAVWAGEPVQPSSIDEHLVQGIQTLQDQHVRVQRDGTAFVTASGKEVDIGRRRVLAKVLATLADADEPLTVEGLCERVWPGERLVGQSGTRRVHVAISTLRGLGLRQHIETVQDEHGAAWRLAARVVDEL